MARTITKITATTSWRKVGVVLGTGCCSTCPKPTENMDDRGHCGYTVGGMDLLAAAVRLPR